MENVFTFKEDISTDIESVTLDIPVRVTMTSYDNHPFEFTSSIDEVGQIVLTPTSKYVEFTAANTADNIDYETPISEQENIESTEGLLTTRETSIHIQANMLIENDNKQVSAVVDEIGQCILYPMSKENIFISASIQNSLNLVTEDMKTETYLNYMLINNGDGWDVKSPDGELIEEGISTLPEAKIFVCELELNNLRGLTENVASEDTDVMPDEEKKIEPEIETEIIEESVSVAGSTTEFTYSEILSVIEDITENFTIDSGALKCDTLTERASCIKILQDHYTHVTSENKNDYFIVIFESRKQ